MAGLHSPHGASSVFPSALYPLLLLLLILSSQFAAVAFAQLSIDGKILVLGDSQAIANDAASVLRGYGIPYQTAVVSSSSALPALNGSGTAGNYGGVVLTGDILSAAQLEQVHAYQRDFGVRLAHLNSAPSAESGTAPAVPGQGCCDPGVEQLVSLTDTSDFPTASLRTGAGMSTQPLSHVPARVADAAVAKEIARFAPAGPFAGPTTAAVINTLDGGRRQQMVWFLSFDTQTSPTSNLVMHAWIHWVTRGLYAGFRRVTLSTQVDDVFLASDIFDSPGATFRLRPEDVQAHKDWQADLNGRLPAGSEYFLEMAHNGNGNIIAASASSEAACAPGPIFYTRNAPATPLEFQKPPGTGEDVWPAEPATYPWSAACVAQDPLLAWFAASRSNLDAFAHLSHTFTHASLNNATYADCAREIAFNARWLAAAGISAASRFSATGLVPPAITGLRNGDCLRALADNGLATAVGDNTRPPLLNPLSEHHALTTTSAANGFAGFTVLPRWATNVYYNCDTAACDVAEFRALAGRPAATERDLWAAERAANARHLLALRRDPFMFHQANLRHADVPTTALPDFVPPLVGKLSLLMLWVEAVAGELARVTTWPLVSRAHDEMAADFRAREARDACAPRAAYSVEEGPGVGRRITGVEIGPGAVGCAARLPLTVPREVVDAGGAVREKRGADPLTLWVAGETGGRFEFVEGIPV